MTQNNISMQFPSLFCDKYKCCKENRPKWWLLIFFQFAQRFLHVNCRKRKSDRSNYLILDIREIIVDVTNINLERIRQI